MPGDPDDDAQTTSWAPFGSYTADDDLPPLPDEPPPLANAAAGPLPDLPAAAAAPLPDLPAAADPAPAREDAPPEVPSWEDFLPHRPAAEDDEPRQPPAEDDSWGSAAEPVAGDEPAQPAGVAQQRPPAERARRVSAPPPAEPKAFFNWTTPPRQRETPEPAGERAYVPGRDDAPPTRKRPAKQGVSGGFALFIAAVAWLWVGPVAAVVAILVGVGALGNPRGPRDRALGGAAIALAALNLLGLLAGLPLFGGF